MDLYAAMCSSSTLVIERLNFFSVLSVANKKPDQAWVLSLGPILFIKFNALLDQHPNVSTAKALKMELFAFNSLYLSCFNLVILWKAPQQKHQTVIKEDALANLMKNTSTISELNRAEDTSKKETKEDIIARYLEKVSQ